MEGTVSDRRNPHPALSGWRGSPCGLGRLWRAIIGVEFWAVNPARGGLSRAIHRAVVVLGGDVQVNAVQLTWSPWRGVVALPGSML